MNILKLVSFLGLLFLLPLIADSQVIVNCPNGQWSLTSNGTSLKKGRCNPDAESSFSNYTVTDCDCDDVENLLLPNNLCKRTVTICSDDLKTILAATPEQTDNRPFFTLDDASPTDNIYNKQGVPWLESLDPFNELNFFNSETSILLFIDEETSCATFDIYVPKGVLASFFIFHEYDVASDLLRSEILIPASGDNCGDIDDICYSSENLIAMSWSAIGNEVSIESVISVPPLQGHVTSVIIDNIDITYDYPYDISVGVRAPDGTYVQLSEASIYSTLPGQEFTGDSNVNTGFSDLGIAGTDANSTELLKPMVFDNLADFNGINPTGDWTLVVNVTSSFDDVALGSLNGWELSVCYIDPQNICFAPSNPNNVIISANGTPTINSVISVESPGILNYLSVSNFITHTYIGDLKISLISPSGTVVVLQTRQCGTEEDMNLVYNDNAISSLVCNDRNSNMTFRPLNALSVLQGENIKGDWTLMVEDLVDLDGGELENWSLFLCTTFCSEALELSSAQNRSGHYQTDATIGSTQKINTLNKIILYEAAQFIELKESFEVNQGTVFHAFIGGCDN